MSILFFILGGIILAYWGFSMNQPMWNRPEIIRRNGGVIVVIGIILSTVGFMI